MISVSLKRPLLLAVTLALVILTTLGFAKPASAASAALPDGTKTANLHIKKEQAPASATAGNGTAQDPGRPAVPGVQFTIKQVNTIDLTTQSGWDKTNTLSGTYNTAAPNSVATAESTITGAGYTLGAGQSATTDANGNVAFSGLPLGLYLVEETSTPPGVTPSAPYLVTLPLTDPNSTSSWLYDVYTYPKNAVTSVAKTVKDASDTKLGDNVAWTITGGLPASTGPNDTVTGYLVTDNLDPKLTYTGVTAALSDGTTLTAGTDYTVTAPAAPNNQLQVKFTAAGLQKLTTARNANDATKVVITVATTVNAPGDISNTAVLYPDQGAVANHDNASCPTCAPGSPGSPTGGTPSTPATTKWGSYTVTKTNEAGSTNLAGAVFKVYPTLADAQADTNAIAVNNGTTTVSTWTTGSDGTVTISGLRDSDFANGQQLNSSTDPGWQDYYLVEVQAPAGYSLLAQPIKFDVTDATSAVGSDLTVKDAAANGGFTLPFTGGVGSSIVYLAGALLLTGALVLGLGRRRPKKSN